MRRLPTLAFAAALAAASLLGACSSSGSDDATSDDPSGAITDAIDGEGTDTTDGTSAETPTLDADEQVYVDAMITSLEINEDEGDLAMEPDQQECLAGRWVQTIGVDRLEAAGIAPEDFESGADPFDDLEFDTDEANTLYDAMGACGIDVKAAFVDAFAMGGELTDAQRSCLEDAISDDDLRASMVAEMIGDDSFDDDAVFGGASECVFPGLDDLSTDDMTSESESD